MKPWLAELHRSQDRLRAVIESSPLAIVELDLERRVIRWNTAAPVRDATGRPVSHVVV